jgi:hypothetical protein
MYALKPIRNMKKLQLKDFPKSDNKKVEKR